MGTPLYTVAELRAIEQTAQRDLASGTLMARAGAAAARRIGETHAGRHLSVCIVCGPGNNGGDGYVLATELKAASHDVVCVSVGPPTTGDARNAQARWRATNGSIRTELPTERFDLIVDGLLGIGQARPLRDRFLAATQWINSQSSTVVAIDLPSGLDADRGSWVDGVAGVSANETITFIGDKPGLHTGDGIDAAGHVELDALGVTPSPSRMSLTDPSEFPQITVPRRRNTHKGTYGNALVVGGAVGMVGAALLAARAALKIGAGRVYVDCLGSADFRVDPIQPELMFRSHTSVDEVQSIVIGCGLGTDDQARRALQSALAADAALVIDADGLNLLPLGPLADDLAVRVAPTVITPHPLEAARLLGLTPEEIQLDRVTSARELATRFRAIVVLKGAGTVVAASDGRIAINSTGSPALATAGTGDVLAGLIGGLLAQQFDPWQATLAAVWLHGRAGDGHDVGIAASEIAPRATAELNALRHRR